MNETKVIGNELFSEVIELQNDQCGVTLNCTYTSLMNLLQARMSLIHLSSATPSAAKAEDVNRLPVLDSEHLPMLKIFYLSAILKAVARLKGWVAGRTSDSESIGITFAFPRYDSALRAETLETLESKALMIGDNFVEYLTLRVLSEVYRGSSAAIFAQLCESADEALNSLPEIFAL